MDELKSIYYAIFSSHLTYGCLIWDQSSTLHVNKIFKLQNRALRSINFQAHDANPDALYRRNKILNLEDFIKLQNCLLVHDYMNNTLPPCMNYNVQTRNSTLGCLFVPNKKTTTNGL